MLLSKKKNFFFRSEKSVTEKAFLSFSSVFAKYFTKLRKFSRILSIDLMSTTSQYGYRIYPYKRPLPINSPPLLTTFANFIFRGYRFTSISTANTSAIPGFRKNMCFSTSPIEYCLREIKKIRTKYGSFDNRLIKICKNMT